MIKPTTYLENVYQDDRGDVNFFEQSYTQNGRAVFRMDDLARYRDATEVGTVDYLLILNRNENIIPSVAKLDQEQAAAYFMLGETTGTSAGGASEAGKFLRSPGRTRSSRSPRPSGQPHARAARDPPDRDLPAEHRPRRRQGRRRALEEGEDPAHSACVKGIAEQTISWVRDDDFGYLVADGVPGFDDVELLQPRRLYEREGRLLEYTEAVEHLKAERVSRLEEFPELSPEIVKAAG